MPPRRAARGGRRALIGSTAALALLAGTWSVTTAHTAAAATATTAAAAESSATSGNLLVDPGAESAAQCSSDGLDEHDDAGLDDRLRRRERRLLRRLRLPQREHARIAGPRQASTSPAGRPGTRTCCRASTVLGGLGLDAGAVPFNLSGWLGGYAGQNDRVGMTATFLNATGASVGTP